MEIEKIAQEIAEIRVETDAMGNEELSRLIKACSDMVILGVVAKEKGKDLLYILFKEKLENLIKTFQHSLEIAEYEKNYKFLERELQKLKSVEEKIKRDALLSKKDLAYMLDVSLPQIDIWLRDFNPIPSIQLREGGAVKFRWCDVVAWVDANNIR